MPALFGFDPRQYVGVRPCQLRLQVRHPSSLDLDLISWVRTIGAGHQARTRWTCVVNFKSDGWLGIECVQSDGVILFARLPFANFGCEMSLGGSLGTRLGSTTASEHQYQ